MTDRDNLTATMRRLKACIVVPTYNNAATLANVLEDILTVASDVIVVNDGSTDSTAKILSRFDGRVTAVSYPDNRGKGHALKAGFRRASDMGYEYAVTIDSDGQHYASDIPAFVRAIAIHPGALIVGSRDLSKVDINGKSSFANKFSNFWFALQTGRRLSDTQTGFRAYPLRKLRGLGLLTSRYEAELELLVSAAWHGVDIMEIPIRVYYPPQAERVSHFRPGLDFTRISLLNTLLCVAAVVYGLPIRAFGALRQRRLFSREWTIFTRAKGKPREAAVTLGRLGRSVYTIVAFTILTVGVLTPFALMYFELGRPTERHKLRFHKLLCGISRFLVKLFPGSNVTFDNTVGETFDSPALIICNHQAHLDLPLLMALHPKIVFLTNEWVWNNPFYGKIIHRAEYLPVTDGVEAIMPQLRDLRRRGYSVVVFPEGTRSSDCSILRFHQGAFMLARELELDVLPAVLHGVGHYLPKTDFMLRYGDMSLTLLRRVSQSELGDMPLRKQASLFRRMIAEAYTDIADRREGVAYWRHLVMYKYAWRGWAVTARAKATLRWLMKHPQTVEHCSRYASVKITGSGIGTFAVLYALVNPRTEVIACESCAADHAVAAATGGIPPNLRFVHAVMESDFDIPAQITIASPVKS